MAESKEELVNNAQESKDEWQFLFRFLVRKEEDLFVAYCLELDLVATGQTQEEATNDLRDVVVEQVSYCIVNDNMDRLFRRAPDDIWEEYYACEKSATPKPRIIKAPSKTFPVADLPPFSFTASACFAQGLCYAR